MRTGDTGDGRRMRCASGARQQPRGARSASWLLRYVGSAATGRFTDSDKGEPLAWLTDVLERMVSGRTRAHELERLLPWAWQAERREPEVRAAAGRIEGFV